MKGCTESTEQVGHELAEVGNNGRGGFADSHAGGNIAFFVPDHPTAGHRVQAVKALQRRKVLIDKAFGAVIAGRFQVLPRLVQGDVGALAPEQRFPDPGKHQTRPVEVGLQQVRVPGVQLPRLVSTSRPASTSFRDGRITGGILAPLATFFRPEASNWD